jgi:hypothetical protein
MNIKDEFLMNIKEFTKELHTHTTDEKGDWKVKGFIDIDESIYGLSYDSKIISTIIEMQIASKLKEFALKHGYNIIPASKQNWYPDLSFVNIKNPDIKFALDIKTTYRLEDYDGFCNGFTLGSHGEYFRNRDSEKNIQFPYSEYTSHICLGALYSRDVEIDSCKYKKEELEEIPTIINNFQFFAEEKWRISSDKGGSGNTANIGSIQNIEDLINGNGIFKELGETVFDEYWINQGVLQVPNIKKKGTYKKLSKLKEFVNFKGLDENAINSPKPKRKNKKVK